MKKEAFVDFGSKESKAVLWESFKQLNGQVKVTWKEVGNTRSLQQNAFYHSVVVTLLLHWMNEQGWQVTHEEAHEHLKANCLAKSIVNEKTGEVMTIAGSTTELTVPEMTEYIDRCAQYIGEKTGRVINERP